MFSFVLIANYKHNNNALDTRESVEKSKPIKSDEWKGNQDKNGANLTEKRIIYALKLRPSNRYLDHRSNPLHLMVLHA